MSDMRNDLINTVDRIVEDRCQKSARDAAEAGEWLNGLWESLEEVGLTRAILPEAAGGTGLDFEDAMLTLRRSAYHAVPLPLAETMLAGKLLTEAGLAVPAGALTVAPAGTGDSLRITRSMSGMRLSGSARRVPWGNVCSSVVVAAEMDGKAMIGLAPAAGALAGVEKNLAGEPRALLRFDASPLTAAAFLDGARQRVELDGALFRSVQMAGALERTLEYSLQYAKERVTFGRPIAKFQAVQQLLAVLAGQVAAASAAVDLAVESSILAPSEFAVAVAKARAGEAAGKSAEIAHQVHGAMGFTHEHNLHYSTRRLWSWRDEYGNETYWQTRLGRMAAAVGPGALWPLLTRMTATK